MRVLLGTIIDGAGDMGRRMKAYPQVFERATGERLFPGTVNVCVAESIPPVEHFRIVGSEIDEPMQDLLFEVCRINEIWAYRIRPYNLASGDGGHSDKVLEIACSRELCRFVGDAKPVRVELFRSSRSLA